MAMPTVAIEHLGLPDAADLTLKDLVLSCSWTFVQSNRYNISSYNISSR